MNTKDRENYNNFAYMTLPERDKIPELNEVNGLCNYECKLLSPLLTEYGMDKEGRPKLLETMPHQATKYLDCSRILSKRAFTIPKELIDTRGFGKDSTGSDLYLKETLDIIKNFNNDSELVPLHVDGDGLCLVHAISRATTGQELFWHALQHSLHTNLRDNLSKYKDLLSDFHDEDEWLTIIDEADPNMPLETFAGGLGNIHIFALSNILKRPIILLDEVKGINNFADYSAIFIPVLSEPDACKNSPICVAWSSVGHNHFIPLVAVEGSPIPKLPKDVLPRVWGNFPQDKILQYLQYGEDGSLSVCSGKQIPQSYLKKLAISVGSVFLDKHGVSTALVCEYYLHEIKNKKFLKTPQVIEKAVQAFNDRKLFKCLECGGFTKCRIPNDELSENGRFYQLLVKWHKKPIIHVLYTFPEQQMKCFYDGMKSLVVQQYRCQYCGGNKTRHVDKLANVVYMNGDAVTNLAAKQPSCCPHKHFWNHHYYDNLPRKIHIGTEYQGQMVEGNITWFYGESESKKNSDLLDVTKEWIHKHHLSEDDGTIRHYLHRQIITELENLGICHRNAGMKDGEGDCPPVEVPSCKNVPILPEYECREESPMETEENVLPDEKSSSTKESTNDMATESGETVPMRLATPPPAVDEIKSIKIKVSTPFGNHTLDIPNDVSLAELKALIFQFFQIPEQAQVLKLGFPPKELRCDNTGPLNIKSGEKIVVEYNYYQL